MRMITLVLGYRVGLRRAERVRWNDRTRQTPYDLPETIGQDLVALHESTTSGQNERDPVEVVEEDAIRASEPSPK